MAIYQYICPNDHYEEVPLSIREYDQIDVVQCQTCNEPMDRVYNSTPAAKFKGPGFYETDYGVKENNESDGSGPGDNNVGNSNSS